MKESGFNFFYPDFKFDKVNKLINGLFFLPPEKGTED